MRPTGSLLGITVLTGVATGVTLAGALTLLTFPHLPAGTAPFLRWLAFGLATLGGVASFFHMHRIQAARFILRRLRTSWLSREALSTGVFVGWLGLLALAPLVTVVPPTVERVAFALAAVFGLVAVFVTAMIYATIPAMRSWHSPLTVVAMGGVGLVTGGGIVAAGLAWLGAPPSVLAAERDGLVASLLLVVAVKALHIGQFAHARAWVRASTGTGLPLGPYRLQDTGTTRPPYRTQTQVWPALTASARTAGYVAMMLLLGLPAVGFLEGLSGGPPSLVAASALALFVGALTERWMFFADATHSSRVWFQDEPRRPSRVAPAHALEPTAEAPAHLPPRWVADIEPDE
jgi:DMSO reductase anchor subunit